MGKNTYVNGNGRFYRVKDEEKIECGADFKVSRVYCDMESGAESYEIEFSSHGEEKVFETNLNTLKKDFKFHGYPVTSNNEIYVNDYLAQQSSSLKATVRYKTLGWCSYKEELAFKAGGLITEKDVKDGYNGELNLAFCGRFSDFKKALKSVIIGNTKLEFAVLAGLTSCVVGYLNFRKQNCNTIVIVIYGGTTTGKTTAAKLSASMCGGVNSAQGKRGILGTCDITHSKLLKGLEGNMGITMVYDEIGKFTKETDTDKLVYDIAEGKSRETCYTGEYETWATTVIFTGEIPLLSKEANRGNELRTLTFADEAWTDSAEQADELDKFAQNFSGIGISKLAKYMIKNQTYIVDCYNEYRKAISKIIPVEEGYRDRVSKPVAIFALTAELASKAFSVKFNTKEIVEFIFAHIKQNQSPDDWKFFYKRIAQKISENKNRFKSSKAEYEKNNKGLNRNYGYILLEKNVKGECTKKLCVIAADILKRWLEEDEFTGEINDWLRKCRNKQILIPKREKYGSRLEYRTGFYAFDLLMGEKLLNEKEPDIDDLNVSIPSMDDIIKSLAEDKPADFNEEGGGADDST